MLTCKWPISFIKINLYGRKLEDFKKEGDGVNANIAQVRFDFYKEKRRFKLIQLGDLIRTMQPASNFIQNKEQLPKIHKIDSTTKQPTNKDTEGATITQRQDSVLKVSEQKSIQRYQRVN